MKPFDEYMEAWCGEREIVYSRYCDDMTFSGVFDGSEVKGKVYGFLRSMGFEPNLRKTRILTRGTRQVVTGLVVNERVRVPAPYRRGLRQEIYYCMKYGAKEHLTRTGRQAYLNDGNGEPDGIWSPCWARRPMCCWPQGMGMPGFGRPR